MADRRKKTTIIYDIAVNTEAISRLGAEIAALNKLLKVNDAQIKQNGLSTESLKDRQILLSEKYERAEAVVRETEEALRKVADAFGVSSGEVAVQSKEVETWRNKLIDAHANLINVKTALNAAEYALSLYRGGIEKLDRQLDTVSTALDVNETALKELGSAFADNMKRMELYGERSQLLMSKASLLTDKLELQRATLERMTDTGNEEADAIARNSVEYKRLTDEVQQTDAKLKETRAEIAGVTSAVKQLAPNIRETGERFERAGDAIQKVGRVLSVVSAAATAAGYGIVNSSKDFESAFAGVRKTVDATEAQFRALERAAVDMSLVRPVTASDVAQIMEYGGQMGIAASRLEDFAGIVADLNVSTDLGIEKASMDMARFSNIMGDTNMSFDRFGATIVALGNKLPATESEIMTMAMQLAGAGKQLNFTAADVLGLAATLESLGIEAERGGSAMSKAMIRMQVAVTQGFSDANRIVRETGLSMRSLELMSTNNTVKFKKYAQSLGMTTTELKNVIGAHKDLTHFAEIAGVSVSDFVKLFNSDAPEALNAFILGLGQTASAGEGALDMLNDMGITEIRLRDTLLRTANAQDLLTESMDIARNAWKSNTALTEEAGRRYETTESQMQLMKNEVTALAISLGKELLPMVRDAVKWAANLLHGFQNLSPESKRLIITVGGIIAVLGPAVLTVGKLVTAFGKLHEVLEGIALTNAAKRALPGIADGVDALTGKSGLLKIAVKEAGEGISRLGQSAFNAIPSFGGFTETLTGFWSKLGLGTLYYAALAAAVAGAVVAVRELFLWLDSPTVSMAEWSSDVSEKTREAADGLVSLEREANAALMHITYTGVALTSDAANRIAANYRRMADDVRSMILEQNAAIEDAAVAVMDSLGITGEDARREFVKTASEMGQAKLDSLAVYDAAINEIINRAADADRKISEQETDEIRYYAALMRKLGVEALTESAAELEAVRRRFADSEKAMTAQEAIAAKILADKVRDEQIAQAESDYKAAELLAKNHYDEMTGMYDEYGQAMVNAAALRKAQRTVEARQENDSVLRLIQEHSGDVMGEINWRDNTIFTQAEKMALRMAELDLESAGQSADRLRESSGQLIGIHDDFTGRAISIMDRMFLDIADGFVEMQKSALSSSKEMKTGVEGEMSGLAKSGYNAGAKFSSGVESGILSKLKDVISAAARVGASAASATNSSLKINSPSKVGQEIGANYAGSIADKAVEVIGRRMPSLRSAFGEMGNIDLNAGTVVNRIDNSVRSSGPYLEAVRIEGIDRLIRVVEDKQLLAFLDGRLVSEAIAPASDTAAGRYESHRERGWSL